MIGVVIPCFNVKSSVLTVIDRIGSEVDKIYIVDDACPEQSGAYVESHCKDSRVTVIRHEKNQGVGGAMVTGYHAAIKDSCSIIVKVDGDNQMDPKFIPALIRPILEGRADYVKGNRFYSLELVSSMPKVRLFGNSGLSFFNKLASGYWSVMDPTNGYTAIHNQVLKQVLKSPLAKDYFFESDLLFRLGTYKAAVCDMPMKAVYNGEVSSLNVGRTLLTFPPQLLKRTIKRILYNYFLRDFSVGSVYLLFGSVLLFFGVTFGAYQWLHSFDSPSTSGTVMLAALPVLLGIQLLISFINFDILNEPKAPIHRNFEIAESA